MRRGPKLSPLKLTKKQRAQLKLLMEGEDQRLAQRAEIVLHCAEGLSNVEVAQRANSNERTVRKWRKQFLEKGMSGLRDGERQGRPKARLEISDEQREVLERYVRRGTISQQLSTRARICLLCAEGRKDTEVAELVGVRAHTVGKWRRRFIELGVDGLTDSDRPGPNRKITDDMVEDLVVRTLESKPKGATQWSTRSMAKKGGMSNATVGRIWRALGLKPHLSRGLSVTQPPFG